MSEPFLGEIRMFGFNYPPKGWALCDGQLLPIKQNAALYALLGTAFGGDGNNNFALPDMRGRVPLHEGEGYYRGLHGGAEMVPLGLSQLPAHRHAVLGTTAAGDKFAGGITESFATSADPGDPTYGPPTSLVTMNDGVISQAEGGEIPHHNVQPMTVINFSIALAGLFPTRS